MLFHWLLFSLELYLLSAFLKTSNYIVATTAGQRAQFVLPDGSKVWLNASTQLAYKSSLWSRERQVNLTGEAYFEVARDEHAPFIVKSKNIKRRYWVRSLMCVLVLQKRRLLLLC